MPSLKDLVRSAEAGDNLMVTGPHSEWLEMLEHEQRPSARAMAYVIRILLGDFKHERSGRFSPSSMGECARRLVFGYAGAPQLPPDIDNQEMMDHGTAAHLKWQIEGLTMGYMEDVEVWVDDPDLLVGGSMDAELHDGSIFELKTAGPFVYNKIVLDQRAPKWENLMQLNTYFMLSGATWGSAVYEDRGSGQFHEFRVEADGKIEREVLRRLRSYKSYVEADELPPLLPDCEVRVGSVYRRCPFRKICHQVGSVSAAAELKQGEHGRTAALGEEQPDWVKSLIAVAHRLEGMDDSTKAVP